MRLETVFVCMKCLPYECFEIFVTASQLHLRLSLPQRRQKEMRFLSCLIRRRAAVQCHIFVHLASARTLFQVLGRTLLGPLANCIRHLSTDLQKWLALRRLEKYSRSRL